MRQSLKVAISLLIATVLFAGFAVLAFSGLFGVLEASFFYPQLQSQYTRQLEELAGKIEKYHADRFEKFREAGVQRVLASARDTRQSDSDIRDRGRVMSEMVSALNVSGVRLVGSDGRDDPLQQLRRGPDRHEGPGQHASTSTRWTSSLPGLPPRASC